MVLCLAVGIRYVGYMVSHFNGTERCTMSSLMGNFSSVFTGNRSRKEPFHIQNDGS
jgi:hypothetical protein